jgi:hypothetical protein
VGDCAPGSSSFAGMGGGDGSGGKGVMGSLGVGDRDVGGISGLAIVSLPMEKGASTDMEDELSPS